MSRTLALLRDPLVEYVKLCWRADLRSDAYEMQPFAPHPTEPLLRSTGCFDVLCNRRLGIRCAYNCVHNAAITVQSCSLQQSSR